ncbi:FAD-dependent oxidoreductase [Methylocystis sp. FS]|uniref:FAD-dependent oxidoreductase n=1 Tax=Methylocystis TaxID=133 RepID=UPI0015832357|nr:MULTISPECIES: FAD-dependent oxidoreductase [Methylocystis]MBG0800381.1 FAD-dependent oxidoreductase [Methylocystis sp. H4A]NUJ81698.1 FAD-dependent oxidoreductase [Methylocystis silviterrae]
MTEEQAGPSGPDLTLGVALAELVDSGKLVGHVGDEEVLLVHSEKEVFAVGAHCTHYHAPLVDGFVVDHSLRCPWHHACFDLRTGEALRAPALDPIACWSVEQRDGKIFVQRKHEAAAPTLHAATSGKTPKNIVIVGGGAAGFAAAERLRRENYRGSIIMLSNEDVAPIDRPNLSKDYLAENAPEEWLPLRPDNFYSEHDIELRLGANATRIDARLREVALADGSRLSYDRLLIATGSEPIRLSISGASLPHVRTLRSLADCRAIIKHAETARRAVVLGASFIGLEVAASLRARGIDVHVIAPEKKPMERIFGSQMGDFVRALHEEHGVVFHLEDVANAIDEKRVTLGSGRVLEADLVVVGVGVRPRIELAEMAGLAIDRGIVVDSYLETNIPGIFAAGDVARWPDRYTGENIRVEHWVVAERQGRTAALNILGQREEFTAVPFFWSQHYDVPINYVGHAEKWDELQIEGDIASKDCLVHFKRNRRTLAVASIFRDIESLQAEITMEQIGAS